MPTWEIIIAILSALASIAGSAFAIKAIIRHQEKMCDKRMDAFKEGLDRGKGDADG